jgi:hypothetical protein
VPAPIQTRVLHRLLGVVIIAFTLLQASCISNHASGRVEMISRAENPVRVDLRFDNGSYSVEPSDTSFYISNLTLEELIDGPVINAQILHAQLLWSPKPGATPVDPTATNLTLRLAIFVDGQLGVYGGAGFAWPSGSIGDGPVELEIVGSTLTLLHSTDGFRDLLSPVLLIGQISAPFDPVRTLRTRQAASQLVTNRLGRTQWVFDALSSFEEQVALRADP